MLYFKNTFSYSHTPLSLAKICICYCRKIIIFFGNKVVIACAFAGSTSMGEYWLSIKKEKDERNKSYMK
jgi:hypothetical protein